MGMSPSVLGLLPGPGSEPCPRSRAWRSEVDVSSGSMGTGPDYSSPGRRCFPIKGQAFAYQIFLIDDRSEAAQAAQELRMKPLIPCKGHPSHREMMSYDSMYTLGAAGTYSSPGNSRWVMCGPFLKATSVCSLRVRQKEQARWVLGGLPRADCGVSIKVSHHLIWSPHL